MNRPAIENKVEHLSIGVKAVGDEAQGLISGYLSTYDLDLGQDRVVKGAFAGSIREATARRAKNNSPFLYPLLWQHSADTLPIGGITEAFEDGKKGLLISAKLDLAQPLAKQCYDAVRFGSIGSLSIGYVTKESSYEHDAATGKTVRLLKSIDLREGSLVLWPMQPNATIESIKAEDDEAKENRVMSTRTISVLKKHTSAIEDAVAGIQQHLNAQRQNALSGWPVYGSSSSSEPYDIASALAALTDELEAKEGRMMSAELHTKIAQASANIMRHTKIIKDAVHEASRFNALAGDVPVYHASSSQEFEEKEADDPILDELRALSASFAGPGERTLESRMDELSTKIDLEFAMASLYVASE